MIHQEHSMTAINLLDKIFKEQRIFDAAGNEYPLGGTVDPDEGEFLMQLIRQYKPAKCIEVGCAYGISSLYICSALEKIPGASHTAIDAWQSTFFKNIGVTNLERAGIRFSELIEGLSELVLPRLLSEGKRYDFCFIDGNHTFDHTLLDFFYLNRMIDVGGIIVFDDAGMPGVKKMIRYALNYPAYRQIGQVTHNGSLKRQVFDLAVKSPFRLVSKLLPGKLKHEIFSGSVVNSDQKLRLNSSMVALQKIAKDERNWDWFKDF